MSVTAGSARCLGGVIEGKLLFRVEKTAERDCAVKKTMPTFTRGSGHRHVARVALLGGDCSHCFSLFALALAADHQHPRPGQVERAE